MNRLAAALFALVSTAALAATDVSHANVVVVRGSADHMEQVLTQAKVKFVAVDPAELPELALNAKQVLMVNCTGDMSEQARERVRRFVAAGGFLYTTDHAVKQLIEPLFPNTIAYAGTTEEHVFPVRVKGTDEDRGLLNSLGGNSKEMWQTAGGGYTFKILDPKRVTVLMDSPQIAKMYGSGLVAARFRYEDGQVIHVTGHFYTQPGQKPSADVASAGQGFTQFSANVTAAKEADAPRIDGLFGDTARREVQLQAAPAKAAPPAATMGRGSGGSSLHAGEKLKVLEKKDGYSKVRDEEGNEGWVDSQAL
jgi:hypothetical protein